MKIFKYIWNTIKGLLISVWVLIAIISTVCLISYNDYSVSEIGKNTILIMDNDDLAPTFVDKDLVIVKKQTENGYKVGDAAFFYLENPRDEIFVNYGTITRIEKAEHAEDSYYFGDDIISYGDMIGKANGAIVYHKVGFLLKIFESRWGFLFLIILPTLYAIVYEIYAIVDEIKNDKETNEKQD